MAMHDDTESLLGIGRDRYVPVYRPRPMVLDHGRGSRLWDMAGKEYVDLAGGIAVCALGHADPELIQALTTQAGKLWHTSNAFNSEPPLRLAEELVTASRFAERVFLCNSGTEANEAAFKLTRATGRTKIVAAEGSFHGRTMGALSITHNPKYREPFAPLPGEVIFVPYGDSEALAAAVDDDTAAVVLEPIQGENGIVVPPDGYLARARSICDQHDALLWLDEVQTGMGRTGSWLVHTDLGVSADVVTLAKGLGNGFPIGACLALGRAAGLLGPGSHGSTFGGNPVAAIAGLAVIAVIERDGLLEQARLLGDHLVETVTALDHPLITGVRGRGLLRGITLAEPVAPQVADAALDAGLIINAPRPDVLRLAPPLIITAEQLDSFTATLPELLDRVQPRPTA